MLNKQDHALESMSHLHSAANHPFVFGRSSPIKGSCQAEGLIKLAGPRQNKNQDARQRRPSKLDGCKQHSRAGWQEKASAIIIKINRMSYVERLIIGAVLLLSAYTLFAGAQERYQFHSALSDLSQLAGRSLGCCRCLELYRQAAVVLIFTGGAALLIDAGITLAILAQLLVTALHLSALKPGLEVAELQTVLIDLALLVFLLRNLGDFKGKPAVEAKASPQAKAEVSQAKAEVSQAKAEAKGGSVQGGEAVKPKPNEPTKPAKHQKKGKAL